MKPQVNSIRPFIGAIQYNVSRQFYTDWGFEEVILSPGMSYFKMGAFGFYLQDACVKDWIDNTMVFLEVANLEAYWKQLVELDLPTRYESVKLVPIHTFDWGKECFVHDPSGVLWHIGEFVTN